MILLRQLIYFSLLVILLSSCAQSKQDLCAEAFELTIKNLRAKMGAKDNSNQMEIVVAAVKASTIEKCANWSEEKIVKELNKIKTMK